MQRVCCKRPRLNSQRKSIEWNEGRVRSLYPDLVAVRKHVGALVVWELCVCVCACVCGCVCVCVVAV